ncbi:MAG: NAD(P)H-dependent glycerol-3-phosphate dehydrogenase [Acidobacteriaceae bacterium]
MTTNSTTNSATGSGRSIAVIGAGSWGTALAISLATRGGSAGEPRPITLWSHSQRVLDEIRDTGTNTSYLRGCSIPPSVTVTNSLQQAARADILLCVVPSQHLRSTIYALAPYLRPEHILVSATKGIEARENTGQQPRSDAASPPPTFLRMSQVIAEAVAESAAIAGTTPSPNRIAVLSGPSFAQEVAAAMPTAITVASTDPNTARLIQSEFSSATLRLYTNHDVVGVELGGALKNVIAVAAGIAIGLGLGHNSIAGLITRGIAEITRLAVACGGEAESLAGLSGLGDLVLTCTGSLSRNRSVGIELGHGRPLDEVLAGLHGKVAEGVRTTSAALGLARSLGVEMPIIERMEAILYQGKPPRDAMRELMSRPGRDE